MLFLARFYRLFNILSLDVALGALGSATMLAYLLDVRLTPQLEWLLPASVWLIYTLDHLLDARRIGHRAHTARHVFHQKHFRNIGVAWVVLFLVSATVTCYIPIRTFYFGLAAAAVAGAHLLMVTLGRNRRYIFFQKEVSVAWIYTLGVAVAPYSLFQGDFTLRLIAPLVLLLLIALTNVLMFAYYEQASDAADAQENAALWLGAWRSSILLTLLCSGAVLLIIAFTLSAQTQRQRCVGLLLLLLALWHFAILLWPGYFSRFERYRYWGDAAFMLPLVLLLV